MSTYYTIMFCMTVMAVIVFIALFFFKAGYGYLSSSNWGPKISNKAAWVLMEVPSFGFMLYYTLKFAADGGAANGCADHVLYILGGLFLLHYFQRSFIFPLMMRGKSKMPIAVMLMGMTFNTFNAYIIGEWLYTPDLNGGMYTDEWLRSPQFIIGTLIFIAGMAINLHSDDVIRNLRKPGDTNHYIPRKGFYKYVTSANYFGELTEWIGYAILTWSPAGALFAIWTFANLGPRAKSLTEKYVAEFGDEYKKLNKKHIIPYIW
jgi:3-oxo-5-alpha-steroid 4-dehydrogenase 1